MMGVSSPYRRPSARDRPGSECTAASARSRSTRAYSSASSASRSNTVSSPPPGVVLPSTAEITAPDRPEPSRHGDLLELLAAGRLLAEPALEAGHPAAGVEDLLLAGVEGVATRADIGVDDAAACRRPRGEGIPAAAGHLGLHVVRVNVRLHFTTPASSVAGSPRRMPPGVNRYRAVSANSLSDSRRGQA